MQYRFLTLCLLLSALLLPVAPATADVCTPTLEVQGEPVSGTAGEPVFVDLLANDSHGCGAPLSVTSVAESCPGTVQDYGDGAITYWPAGTEESCAISYSVVSEDGGFETRTANITFGGGGSGGGPPPGSMLLSPHPQNPRYLVAAGDPNRVVFLTGSHVWNNFVDWGPGPLPNPASPPFDHDAFLDALHLGPGGSGDEGYGHNFIRGWVWENSRYPDPISPCTANEWNFAPLPYERVSSAGNAHDGQPRFDLDQLDLSPDSYLQRMRSRIRAARALGMYYGVMLFQPINYGDKSSSAPVPAAQRADTEWHYNPYNAGNNVNGVDADFNDDGHGWELSTLLQPGDPHYDQHLIIRAKQEAYVRGVIDFLKDEDNVIWEIGNEGSNSSQSWQNHMAGVVRDHETNMGYMQRPVWLSATRDSGSGQNGGVNTWLNQSPADVVSYYGIDNSFRVTDLAGPPVHNPGGDPSQKISLLDTDHLCGTCGPNPNNPGAGDPSGSLLGYAYRAFTRGHNLIYMDPKDLGGCPWGLSDPGPAAEDFRIALGKIREFSVGVDLVAMSPKAPGQPGITSSEFALYEPSRQYLIYHQGTNAPDPDGAGPLDNLDVTIENLEAGTYSFQWTNIGSNGVQGSGSVTITTTGEAAVLRNPSPSNARMLLRLVNTGAPPPTSIVFTSQPQPASGQVGDTGVFFEVSATVNPPGPLTFSWHRTDGQPVRATVSQPTPGTSRLTFPPLELGDQASYFCAVSSGAVSVNSQVATLTVTQVSQTLVSDHFGLGTELAAGDPLDGVLSERGNRVWAANANTVFGGDSGNGYINHSGTGTSGFQVAGGVPFDPDSMVGAPSVLTVGADAQVTSGTGWVAVGLAGSAVGSFWTDGAWLLVQSTGHWTLYDGGHGSGALSQSTAPVAGFLAGEENAIKLQYDRIAGTISAWVNEETLVVDKPLQSSPPVTTYAGFHIFGSDNDVSGRIRVDDFWAMAGTAGGEQDDALVVSQSFPSTMACGQTAGATVRVKNTGNTAWYRLPVARGGGYKWDVLPSDPFTPTHVQVWLGEGETIFPEEERTFTWNLTAPPTASPSGTATAGRMIRENVTYFGQVASASIIVSCDNLPPIAGDDFFGVAPPDTLLLRESTLLANDDDPDGDPSTLSFNGFDPSGMLGQLAPVTAGIWRYTAPADPAVLQDTLSYEVQDVGGLTDQGTIHIQIDRNSPPVAGADTLDTPTNVSLAFDSAQLLANDSDPDPLDTVVFPLQELTADQGSIVRTSSTAPYTYVYTPPDGFQGTDSFTYLIEDNHGRPAAQPGQVTINVTQEAPVPQEDRALVPYGATLFPIPDSYYLSNDTDANGDPLTVASLGDPAFGSFVLSQFGQGYSPDPEFWSVGSDAFTYQVTDGSFTVQSLMRLEAEPLCDTYLGDGAETGDTSAWSSVAAVGGGSILAETTAAAEGSYGFRVAPAAATTQLYLQDVSPAEETHFRSGFLLHTHDFVLAGGDQINLFTGFSPGRNAFTVRMADGPEGLQLLLVLSKDGGGVTSAQAVDLGEGAWHRVFVDWWAASAPGAKDGGGRLWVDGLLAGELLGLDNDELRVATVRLGAVFGLDPGFSGSFYLDSYTSCDGPKSERTLQADDFEGDLTGWEHVFQSGGGTVTVSAAAALEGAQGLAIGLVEGAGQVHVRQKLARYASTGSAQFLFDPNSLAMAEGSAHPIFVGNSPTGSGV
ncbi:MAG: cadherin-like domain-containing protein, partial [Acidobacteria bacterium]|nr:cadherin-like domain-containing protein [Acidobacteriota bacterium]